MRKRVAAFILLGSLGLLAGILAACGGGSSSNTGPSAGGGGGFSGSSGAVVQGQLRRGTGSAQSEAVIFVVFRTALGIGLAEAAPTTPLAGATVTLSGPGGPFTTTTDADGKFTFGDLVAGTYTFSVCTGTPSCETIPIASPSPAEITVGPADVGTINGTVFNDDSVIVSVDVVAESVSAEGVFRNDAQLCIASRLAQGANVPLGQIIDLRLKGMGWGKIAKQKGLHSGMIGGGIHCDAAELADVRAANGQGNGKNKAKGQGNGKGKA
jgi:Carboxypeptidase regulatory-like domain